LEAKQEFAGKDGLGESASALEPIDRQKDR
jgi:hypothetical protein